MPDIIIVEDNREIGTLLCDFLRKENYTVSLVDTGEKALQIFEQYGANLVVIDIGLPGVDGYSVCSKIRETSNAHIMIATARDDKESTLKGLQIGADDYICKPYDIDILIAKINGIFKRKYALDEIVCDNLKLNNVTQTLTGSSFRKSEQLFNDRARHIAPTKYFIFFIRYLQLKVCRKTNTIFSLSRIAVRVFTYLQRITCREFKIGRASCRERV